MSRIYYSDDEGGIPVGLWEANLRRAIAGRRGQRALRDLIDALEALPERKLIANDSDTMADQSGAVCAVGAYALHKAAQRDFPGYLGREQYLDRLRGIETDWDTMDEASRWGMTRILAWSICEWNDEIYGSHTPEERYEGILRWARAQLVEEAVA